MAAPSEKDVRGGSELVQLVMQLKREIDGERSQFDREREKFGQQIAQLSGALKGAELERDTAIHECERLRGSPQNGGSHGAAGEALAQEGVRSMALEADLAAAKKLIAEMERDAASARGASPDPELQAKLEAAHADAAHARERVAIVEAQRAGLASRIAEVENARREAENALNAARAELASRSATTDADHAQDRERLIREASDLRIRIAELETALASSSERTTRMDSERAAERKQAEVARADLNSKLQATEEAQGRIIRESGEIMAQLSAQRSALEADLGRSVSRVATLESELQNERERAAAKVNELSRLHARERDDHRIALATADENRARLVADITQLAQQLVNRARGDAGTSRGDYARDVATPQAMPRPVLNTPAPPPGDDRPKTGKIDLNDMMHRAKRLKPPGQS